MEIDASRSGVCGPEKPENLWTTEHQNIFSLSLEDVMEVVNRALTYGSAEQPD